MVGAKEHEQIKSFNRALIYESEQPNWPFSHGEFMENARRDAKSSMVAEFKEAIAHRELSQRGKRCLGASTPQNVSTPLNGRVMSERHTEIRHPLRNMIGSVPNYDRKDALISKFMTKSPFFGSGDKPKVV